MPRDVDIRNCIHPPELSKIYGGQRERRERFKTPLHFESFIVFGRPLTEKTLTHILRVGQGSESIANTWNTFPLTPKQVLNWILENNVHLTFLNETNVKIRMGSFFICKQDKMSSNTKYLFCLSFRWIWSAQGSSELNIPADMEYDKVISKSNILSVLPINLEPVRVLTHSFIYIRYRWVWPENFQRTVFFLSLSKRKWVETRKVNSQG